MRRAPKASKRVTHTPVDGNKGWLVLPCCFNYDHVIVHGFRYEVRRLHSWLKEILNSWLQSTLLLEGATLPAFQLRERICKNSILMNSTCCLLGAEKPEVHTRLLKSLELYKILSRLCAGKGGEKLGSQVPRSGCSPGRIRLADELRVDSAAGPTVCSCLAG